MCGRFAMPWDPDELAERLGLDTDEDARDVTPSYNIRPGATIAVIRHAKDGADMLSGARWSLIPAWSPTDRLAYPTFNARVETAADRPAFRDAARSGRILVPMLGYYEWDIHRQPHWFHSHNDGILLAAGLLSIWRGMPTCTILTRQAEGRCARVHDRMPVLIPNAHTGAWLDPQTDAHTALHDADTTGGLMVRTLDSHQVAPLHADGPGLTLPIPKNQKQGTLFD